LNGKGIATGEYVKSGFGKTNYLCGPLCSSWAPAHRVHDAVNIPLFVNTPFLDKYNPTKIKRLSILLGFGCVVQAMLEQIRLNQADDAATIALILEPDMHTPSVPS
jgi:hypothetical protein